MRFHGKNWKRKSPTKNLLKPELERIEACRNTVHCVTNSPGVQINCTVDYVSKKWTGFKHFYHRKTAVNFNFCLIGNICHNFLVTRMIESASLTFWYSETRDLHRSNNVLHKSCLTTFSANESVIVNQKMPVFGFQIATKE